MYAELLETMAQRHLAVIKQAERAVMMLVEREIAPVDARPKDVAMMEDGIMANEAQAAQMTAMLEEFYERRGYDPTDLVYPDPDPTESRNRTVVLEPGQGIPGVDLAGEREM